jgi:hypothetical protein
MIMGDAMLPRLDYKSIPGTKLRVRIDDDEIEFKGPCGHCHIMTRKEAVALVGWLMPRVGSGAELHSMLEVEIERNAMLDAEIGIA